MLYVFHVDTGEMLNLNMELTMKPVEALKIALELRTHVPKAFQVRQRKCDFVEPSLIS